MKPLRIDVILALLLLTILLTACGGGSKNGNSKIPSNSANTGNENANAPKTNVEELGILVNVPYVAEDIVWKENVTHKKLIAVLRFSAVDCEKIVADAAKYSKPGSVTVENETWFPDDLIALGDMSGDDTLKGISYSADTFLQDPFNEGRLVRIEGTNYFVLEATAK